MCRESDSVFSALFQLEMQEMKETEFQQSVASAEVKVPRILICWKMYFCFQMHFILRNNPIAR